MQTPLGVFFSSLSETFKALLTLGIKPVDISGVTQMGGLKGTKMRRAIAFLSGKQKQILANLWVNICKVNESHV